MKNNKLKDKKVGDWVYHIINGWEKKEKSYFSMLRVNGKDYLQDGRRNEAMVNPTIYPYNPFHPDELPPCDFKRGEVFMVNDHGDWTPRIFHNMTDDGQFRDSNNRWWDRARILTDKEKGE